MKAFLSHSSKDKGFVESVADYLRPGTYELDALTFDAGLLNSAAIIKALERSDLFCLFLSAHSIKSTYVEFETLLGMEFFARGSIQKFLAICLDDRSFEAASANVKFFNIVRKNSSPESTARLIQGNLLSASSAQALQAHPFIGRENELLDLERQITNHSRPPSRALFISGTFGSGRRTVAKKFYENQYPAANRIFPIVKVDEFYGPEELYRRLLIDLRPTTTPADLKVRAQAFQVASTPEKYRLIAQLINSLLPAREAAMLVDEGGILSDSGSFQPDIDQIIDQLESRPFPAAIVIARRMIPLRLRRPDDDVSYLALKSFDRETSERLISRLLRDKGVSTSAAQMEQLVTLGDGHPFNVYRMVDEIVEVGLDPFLANPRHFIDWKHRQSSEYIGKIEFADNEKSLLGLLKVIPELDFEGLSAALSIEPSVLSDALSRLLSLHVVESTSDRFLVSPALRVAVERDRRLVLSDKAYRDAISKIADSLSIRLEDGTAAVSLIDTAVLSALERGGALPSVATVFLLPSHYVWLAKKNYDQRKYHESIRLARDALRGADRLSTGGIVAASRYLCLAATRIGDDDIFAEGMAILERSARDDWARSNTAFLKGFNYRMKGQLPSAEEEFRKAYDLSPGNLPAARELAAVCLARGNLDDAEKFAREAHSHAPSNPYLLDILISVLIRRHGRNARHMPEIDALFQALEKVGEEEGRSFFTTRKAEYEYLCGDNRLALTLIDEAAKKTPTIFETQRLRAEILLKDGRKAEAGGLIDRLRELANARDPRERRTNYRSYLETYSRYLQEIGEFEKSKQVYQDSSMFTDEERVRAIKEIEIAQSYRRR